MRKFSIYQSANFLFQTMHNCIVRLVKLSILFILMFYLTGCSQSIETFNPDLVEMSITFNSNEVRGEEQADFRIDVVGMESVESYEVAISYVQNGKNTYHYLEEREEHTFIGSLIFDESGDNTIYIHIFGSEIHLMKKHVVKVT